MPAIPAASNPPHGVNTRGVTLVELILFGSLSAAMLLWLASWLAKPARIQQKLLAVMDEQRALRGTDAWVNDFKQMLPGTLILGPESEGRTLTLSMAGDTLPDGSPPGVPVSVQYSFEPYEGKPGGALYRTAGGTRAVVLNDVLGPETSTPLFRRDPELPIVTIDLRVKTSGGVPLRVVRRAAIPD